MRLPRLLAIASLTFGPLFVFPSAQAAYTGNVQVTCANIAGQERTNNVSWDNSNQFFAGKGNIAQFYCHGGYAGGDYTIFIGTSIAGSDLLYYNGLVPIVNPTPEPVVETPTVPDVPVAETVTPVVPVDTQTPSVETPTVVENTDTPTVSSETPTVIDTSTSSDTTTVTVPVEPQPEPVPVVVETPPARPEPVVEVPRNEPEPVQPDDPTPVEPEVPSEPEVPEEPQVPVEEPEVPEEVVDPVDVEPTPEPVVEPESPEEPLEPPVVNEPTVTLDNGVVLTQEQAIAVALLQDPAALLQELFTDPGAALAAFGQVGADMSPEVREQSEKVVISAVIAGNIATVSAGAAAYRRRA